MRLAVPLVFGLAACASAPQRPPPDPCASLEGRTFVSASLLPGGLPAQGEPPQPMQWKLEFQQGSFLWIHTDMVESGPYSCSGGVIRAESPAGTREGHVENGAVEWEGQRYVPAEARAEEATPLPSRCEAGTFPCDGLCCPAGFRCENCFGAVTCVPPGHLCTGPGVTAPAR